MDPTEYESVKFFLTSAIDHFNVSPENTHIAVMTYGKQAKLVFDFHSIQKWNDNIKNKINDLELTSGANGKLEDVLKLACDKIFCTAGGTRDNVPKVFSFRLCLIDRFCKQNFMHVSFWC